MDPNRVRDRRGSGQQVEKDVSSREASSHWLEHARTSSEPTCAGCCLFGASSGLPIQGQAG